MEREIGEVFDYNGKKLKVVCGQGCDDCFFQHGSIMNCMSILPITGNCRALSRKDSNSVIFKLIKSYMKEETKTIEIPDGYEFDRVDDGEVILKKKEVVLPKNYTECLDSIKFDSFSQFYLNVPVPQGMVKPINSLCRLLICRNAWWKQLGWKPNFNDAATKYNVKNISGSIIVDFTYTKNELLCFPSKKIADKFLEAFKDLIEQAKELL